LNMFLAVIGLLLYPIGIPMVFLSLMHTERVHELAIYKQARLEVARLIKNVALRNKTVHEFVVFCAADRIFEEVPTDMLELVVQDLCPVYDDEEESEDAKASTAAGVVHMGEDFKAELDYKGDVQKDAMDLENAERELEGKTTEGEEEEEDPLRRRERMVARLLIFAHNDPVGKRLTALPKMGWLERDGSLSEHSTAYQVKERRAYSRLGSIFNMYHVKTWWYELLDLARKLTMNGVLLFVGRGSTGQVALGSLVCMFMTCIHLKINPFIDPTPNRLSMCCLLQLTATLFVGLLLKVDITSEDEVSGDVLGTLVVALNVSIIMVPIVELVMLCGHLSKRGQNKRALNPLRTSLHVRSERMIENPTKSGNLVNEDGTETKVEQEPWEGVDNLDEPKETLGQEDIPIKV